jgi:CubicO group peptidase (beta-lactamase class C family)
MILLRILKWLGVGLAVVIALPVIAGVGLYVSDPLYYGRYFGSFTIDPVKDVDWYGPLEPVPGIEGPALPRAANGARTISRDAWNAAVGYAEETESVALLVWHRGALQCEHYGQGFDRDSRTDPASMHKSVVALLVGAAIADGTLRGRDTPAAQYLTEWADDDRRHITIEHMLHMTSGLYKDPFSLSPFASFQLLNHGTELEQLTLSQPAREAPGQVFDYNNFNPQALSIVLERATGKRYAEVLSEKLWSKLGTRTAYAYLDRAGGLPRTYCCLHATAEDWLRIGLLHLNKGRVGDVQVLPESWMNAVTAGSEPGPNYGYLTWLGSPYDERRGYGPYVATYAQHDEPYVADDVILFDGAGGQRVYVIPSYDMVIVRTGTGGIDFSTGSFTWEDSFLPNTLMRGVVDPPAAP